MAMYPFVYKATIADEYAEGCEGTVKGVTFGDSYVAAMNNIESYYGDELIDIQIECQEEAPVYEFENYLRSN